MAERKTGENPGLNLRNARRVLAALSPETAGLFEAAFSTEAFVRTFQRAARLARTEPEKMNGLRKDMGGSLFEIFGYYYLLGKMKQGERLLSPWDTRELFETARDSSFEKRGTTPEEPHPFRIPDGLIVSSDKRQITGIVEYKVAGTVMRRGARNQFTEYITGGVMRYFEDGYVDLEKPLQVILLCAMVSEEYRHGLDSIRGKRVKIITVPLGNKTWNVLGRGLFRDVQRSNDSPPAL